MIHAYIANASLCNIPFCRCIVMFLWCVTNTSSMSLCTHLVNLVTLRKSHPLVAKEDHPFVNGYDKSTLSYEKELPNRRVVAKVR